ncbi:MAG: geranylgeranylglyceryl/heptaprenylglyceryl phosphate synthase [Promethearchaeota archaeon]
MKNNDTRKVYQYILESIKEQGAMHASLIDPDPQRQSIQLAGKMAFFADKAGTDMFLVGGSTCFDQEFINKTILEIKKNSDKPVVIFPGNINGVSKFADAILFISILNSTNQYFISGQQALGAYAVKKADIEPISTAYLIVEPGCTAGWMADVKPLPRDKPELTAGYALSAQYMGFKFIYLEAGSGSVDSIPEEMIRFLKKIIKIPLIVGGGINSLKDASKKVKAGADIIVQGSFLEDNLLDDEGKSLEKVIQSIKQAGKLKLDMS